MKYQWSETILKKMEQYKSLMFEAERWLWKHPQTGFKEWDAHNYLKEHFLKMGLTIKEAGNIPGFSIDIDTGKDGPVMAILGELDAMLVPDHPECDPNTGAVHACGHNCQVSALLGVAGVLSDPDVLSKLCGKIRIIAVPAEELIELEERSKMKESGQIKYLSGKSEFLRRGFFDGVDIAMMIHTSGGEKPGMHVGPGTTGIMAKKITYFGSKYVHGANPCGGVNAMYAAQTAFNSINALREIFPDNYRVRYHPTITRCEKSVQHMPSEVVIEAHVRATDLRVLKDVNDRINRAHAAAALAFGAKIKIEDLECYIPENDRMVPTYMQLAYDIGCDLMGAENVRMDTTNEGRSPGGTDMGNIGAIIPCIQPYSTGQVGDGHGPTFQLKYPECAVFYPAVVQAAVACVLLDGNGEMVKKIIAEYKPIYSSIDEYLEEMDKIYDSPKTVEYDKLGKATVYWK